MLFGADNSVLEYRTCGCEANRHHVLQRKFREEHDEESYFEGGDDDQLPEQQHPPSNSVVPPAVDEVAAQEGDGDLHRTARMFSLQNPSINHSNPTPHNDAMHHAGQHSLSDQDNATPVHASEPRDDKVQ